MCFCNVLDIRRSAVCDNSTACIAQASPACDDVLKSRRLGIRLRRDDGRKKTIFAHTLNATACAVPRVLIALLEQVLFVWLFVCVLLALKTTAASDVHAFCCCLC